jgi:hypothetical protein
MAPRRRRKEGLPLTFKYCMIHKIARQRWNDDVRCHPPSADYNIVASYNLQSKRKQLFAGQAPRVSSSNIPVFHPTSCRWLATIWFHNTICTSHVLWGFILTWMPRRLLIVVKTLLQTLEDRTALSKCSRLLPMERLSRSPLSESDLELHLASPHREDVVACFGMNLVAMRNFVIQLHEEAASESSFELQLAYSRREVPVARGVEIRQLLQRETLLSSFMRRSDRRSLSNCSWPHLIPIKSWLSQPTWIYIQLQQQ